MIEYEVVLWVVKVNPFWGWREDDVIITTSKKTKDA